MVVASRRSIRSSLPPTNTGTVNGGMRCGRGHIALIHRHRVQSSARYFGFLLWRVRSDFTTLRVCDLCRDWPQGLRGWNWPTQRLLDFASRGDALVYNRLFP